MNGHCLTNEQILAFSTALFLAERSQATMEKYLRSVRAFSLFLDGQPVTKDTVMAWKKHLQREEKYSPSTVNASLAALNYLFNFLSWSDCRTHYLKIQRRLFRETGRELDRADYRSLSSLFMFISSLQHKGIPKLITFYQQLRDNYPLMQKQLDQLQQQYEANQYEYEELKRQYPNERCENRNEALYYHLREQYNHPTGEYLDGVLYYFINKTAYSGMIRYNSHGEYNVPFGRYRHFNTNRL